MLYVIYTCTASSFNPLAINDSSNGKQNSLIPSKMTNSTQFDASSCLLSSLDEFISMRTALSSSSSLKPLSQLCQGL